MGRFITADQHRAGCLNVAIYSGTITINIKEFEARDDEHAARRLEYIRYALVEGTPLEGLGFTELNNETKESV